MVYSVPTVTPVMEQECLYVSSACVVSMSIEKRHGAQCANRNTYHGAGMPVCVISMCRQYVY